MNRLTRCLFVAFVLSFSALGEKAPLTLEMEPGTLTEVDLADKTQLKGPFLLVSGPSWVSVNSQGILLVDPPHSAKGKFDVELEVRTGSTWVQFDVQLNVVYFQYAVKVFTAPWCQTCRTLVPEIEQALFSGTARQVDLQVYLETDYDLYEPASKETAEAYRKDLNLKSPVIADAWKWLEYRKHFSKGFRLPAAVVYRVGAKNKVILGPGHFEADRVRAALDGLIHVGGAPALSVLWVIDNSGSMQSHQQTMKKSADQMFKSLGQQALRWKMGMVTTDLIDPSLLPLSGAGVLDWLMKDATKVFTGGIDKAGVAGSGVEKPLEAVMQHLKQNPDFVAPNQSLAVVVVTDEDDQGTVSTQDYLQTLVRTVGDIRRVQQFSLVHTKDLGCNSITGGGAAYLGSRLEEVTKFTRGKAFPLCQFDRHIQEFTSLLGSMP